LLYVTPPEETSNWTDGGISGRVRLLHRIWRACDSVTLSAASGAEDRALPAVDTADDIALLRAVHLVAKSAIDETLSRRFHYNTTIAKLDELVNLMTAASSSQPASPAFNYAVRTLPILIAPFAPHIAEELWERLGHRTSVHLERYVEPDARALAVEAITLVVQVNGRVRARIPAPAGVSEDEALALALADPNVRGHLGGKELRKRIYVPDKLLNLVA
ncbi:MAG: class I tRNA ligase family protein, partial [Candidatus Eremiobacteraeota bacterium]|nr:class I tRNA ligase family protein [Candidatus Eremiobacteraeota bacterium]